jgi:hypothetical protein
MELLRRPTEWLVDLAQRFPEPVQPGLFGAVCLFLVWALVRRRRALWNRAIRAGSGALDLGIGLALFPEYVWTTARRARGQLPGSVAMATQPIAERLLSTTGSIYENHAPVKETGHPPIWTPVLVLAASLFIHWGMQQVPSNEYTDLATTLWGYWTSLSRWAHGA